VLNGVTSYFFQIFDVINIAQTYKFSEASIFLDELCKSRESLPVVCQDARDRFAIALVCFHIVHMIPAVLELPIGFVKCIPGTK